MSKLGNQVLVAGNVTAELKEHASKQEGGKSNITFGIAVNSKNKEGSVSYFNIVVFDGRLISDLKRNVTKGSYVVVSGYLSTRKTDTGSLAQIVADSVVISPFMGGMATAFFSGRIVKPIGLVTAPSGKQFKATLIAVNEKHSDGTEHTDFINVSLGDKLLQSDVSGFEVGDIVSMNGFFHVASEKKENFTYNNAGLHILELPKLIMKAKTNQPAQQPVQQAQPMYQQPLYQAPVPQAQPMYQQPVAQQQPAYQQQPAAQAAPTGMEMSSEQYNALTGGTGFSYDITSDDLPF